MMKVGRQGDGPKTAESVIPRDRTLLNRVWSLEHLVVDPDVEDWDIGWTGSPQREMI
jgi:hypothetical protein